MSCLVFWTCYQALIILTWCLNICGSPRSYSIRSIVQLIRNVNLQFILNYILLLYCFPQITHFIIWKIWGCSWWLGQLNQEFVIEYSNCVLSNANLAYNFHYDWWFRHNRSLIWSDYIIVRLCRFHLEDNVIVWFVNDFNLARALAIFLILFKDYCVGRVQGYKLSPVFLYCSTSWSSSFALFHFNVIKFSYQF
jgi:hypothetical protein